MVNKPAHYIRFVRANQDVGEAPPTPLREGYAVVVHQAQRGPLRHAGGNAEAERRLRLPDAAIEELNAGSA